MDRISGKLTIYFEDPFWVGIFEKIENRRLHQKLSIFLKKLDEMFAYYGSKGCDVIKLGDYTDGGNTI